MSTTLLRLPPVPDTLPTLLPSSVERAVGTYGNFYWPTAGGNPQRHCFTCEGSGQFLWIDEDKPAMFECDCIGQWRLFTAFAHAGIWERYMRLGWADLSGLEPEARELATQYLYNLKVHLRTGRGLFFHGNIGTGKSLLANLILKQVVALGHSGYFTTFADMLTSFQEGWRDPEQAEWFRKRVMNARVLVVDEVGKEKRNEEVVDAFIDSIFRHRVASGYPTIITSNMDVEGIAERYGESIGWLLTEGVSVYTFVGSNFRSNGDALRDVEVFAGLARPVTIR